MFYPSIFFGLTTLKNTSFLTPFHPLTSHKMGSANIFFSCNLQCLVLYLKSASIPAFNAATMITIAKTCCRARTESFFSARVAPAIPPASAVPTRGNISANPTFPLKPCAASPTASSVNTSAEFRAAVSRSPAQPRNRINGPRKTPLPIPKKLERKPMAAPAGMATSHSLPWLGAWLCFQALGAEYSIVSAATVSAIARSARKIRRLAVVSPSKKVAGIAWQQERQEKPPVKTPSQAKSKQDRPGHHQVEKQHDRRHCDSRNAH